MLNINLECSQVYAQHFQSYNSCAPELMLNINLEPRLMPNTSNFYNSCAPDPMLNTKSHNSCVSKLTLNTKSHHLCASGFIPNTLCNSIMHSVFCTFHHNNHLIICIKVNHIIHPVHRTTTIIFVHQGPCPTYTITYKIIKHKHWIMPNIYN